MASKTIHLVQNCPRGPILDYLVARALGYVAAKKVKMNWGYAYEADPQKQWSSSMIGTKGAYRDRVIRWQTFGPSSESDVAMHLAEKHRISVGPAVQGTGALASCGPEYSSEGSNYTEAICRCLVMTLTGHDEYTIPDDFPEHLVPVTL